MKLYSMRIERMAKASDTVRRWLEFTVSERQRDKIFEEAGTALLFKRHLAIGKEDSLTTSEEPVLPYIVLPWKVLRKCLLYCIEREPAGDFGQLIKK